MSERLSFKCRACHTEATMDTTNNKGIVGINGIMEWSNFEYEVSVFGI